MKFTPQKTDKLLWSETKGQKSVATLANKVAKILKGSSKPFSLWLYGDIGAGKTTFTGALLHALGLNPNSPVNSPTYTYLIEYKIAEQWYAHMDFYRFTAGSSFEEEEMLVARDYSGFILEWPVQVDLPDSMAATHKLEIKPDGQNQRTYNLYDCL
jgi:tRNA threonylcarbamoyl adenosine modification protein YjeE